MSKLTRTDCKMHMDCYIANVIMETMGFDRLNECKDCQLYKSCRKQPKKPELKPCPFCGGEAERKEDTACMGHGDFCTYQIIQCKECGARVTGGYYGENDNTVEKWNRRV